jgi:hypothetical protein
MKYKVKKSKSIQQLKKIADRWFSLYIRYYYSKDGYVKCFTCDKVLPIKEIDNGHFVSRTNGNLRYHTKNCRPQCRWCNRYREGMKDEFAVRLERETPGILEELNLYKNMPATPFNWLDLKNMIEEFKKKVKKLE